MSSNRLTQIGLDRLVHLAWLEKVSSLILDGNTAVDIKATLQKDLKGAFQTSRTDVRGSIDKTITILTKVWIKVPTELDSLRTDGLKLLRDVPRCDHLVLHWGMVMAVYPFWSGVAMQVGRLLRLQGSSAATQVQRRIREQYGERETVQRRTRYVLRSYLDWGVLLETGTNGIYTAGAPLVVDDSRLIAWMVEAFLHTREGGSAPLKDVINSPIFFPFLIKPIHSESLVAASSRLDILRHGLDIDLVMLRRI